MAQDIPDDDDDLLATLVRAAEAMLHELGAMERALANAPRERLDSRPLREIIRRRAVLAQDGEAFFALLCDARLTEEPN